MTPEAFHGTWRLNIESSTLPFAAPKSVLLSIEVKADSVRIIENSVSATGISETVTIEAEFDNKEHPVIGSSIADGFAIRRVQARRWETRGFKLGKEVFSAVLLMSEDGQSFREDGVTTLTDGRSARMSLLYERDESRTGSKRMGT